MCSVRTLRERALLSFRVSVFARVPRCVGRVEVGGPGAASRDAAVDGARSGNVILTNPNGITTAVVFRLDYDNEILI